MNNGFRALALTAMGILSGVSAAPVMAEEVSTRLSIGYDYSSGDYGQGTTTEIETIPVNLRVLKGAWRYELTVPYIAVTGNGSVVPGAGGPMGVFNRMTTTTTTESGLGDITATVGYTLPSQEDFYEISARVKLGTADVDRGLGTGENDYYLQLDGVLGSGGLKPWFTLGYVITGDSATTTYKDVAYGTVGVMGRGEHGGSLGVAYDYRQATVAGGDALAQVSAFVSWKTSGGGSVMLSGSLGLSDAAADYGFSVTLRGGD